MSSEIRTENAPLFNPEEKAEEINPQAYFNAVKERRKDVTDSDLDRFYENCLTLINKYKTTGQKAALRKLLFQIDCIAKERELVKADITTFVYEDDITDYIENVAQKTVKIIDIENYQRDIPEEIADVIGRVGHLFDKLYIVFTDYTGKEERRVAKERKDKDPILFGVFRDEKNHHVVERFWYLGDWIDEYCDLTLDKMVSEMKSKSDKDIVRAVYTPTDLQQLKDELNLLASREDVFIRKSDAEPRKKSFADRVRTFLNRG